MTAVEDFLQATMPRFIDAELSLHSGDGAGATHVYRREGGEWKIVHRIDAHPPVDRTSQPDSRGWSGSA